MLSMIMMMMMRMVRILMIKMMRIEDDMPNGLYKRIILLAKSSLISRHYGGLEKDEENLKCIVEERYNVD